jgi:hypothetical protein
MNDELERAWKGVVMGIFKVLVLSHHLPGGTEEKHKKCQ